MNMKKILGLTLCAILSTSVFVGCSNSEKGQASSSTEKVEIVKETAFETVPENSLIPTFVKDKYAKESELLDDYKTTYIAFWCADGIENPRKDEVFEKYSLSTGLSKVKELRDQNPNFYEGLITYVIATSNSQKESMPFVDEMLVKAQDYISNSLLGENNELDLSKEFAELKPVEYIQNYLNKNNIKITNVDFPDDWENFHMGAATNVVGLTLTIEGTQNGESFSKTRKYDFHFAASQDLRDGEDIRRTNNMSLMAVTESSFEGANTFNCDKFQKLF